MFSRLIIVLVMCSPKFDTPFDMQVIYGVLIDRTEISITEFQRFVSATQFVSQAECAGGGEVCAWAGNKSPGGLGKLHLVSSPTLN